MPTLPTAVPGPAEAQAPKPTARPSIMAACGKCKNTWFEEVRVARVHKEQYIAPGQSPHKLSDTFVLLRCARCLELHEPPLVASASPGYKGYMTMVAELDQAPPRGAVPDIAGALAKKESEV